VGDHGHVYGHDLLRLSRDCGQVSLSDCSVVWMPRTGGHLHQPHETRVTVEQPGRIGVDIGAVSLKAVRIDGAGRVVQSFYARHKGEPAPVLERALRELDLAPGDAIGFCGLNATRFC